MKLIKSDIFDVNKKNLDETKILIADNILNAVGPLFESEIQENTKKLDSIKKSKQKIDIELDEVKDELQKLQIEFGRETKRKKLLNRIRQLIEANLTSDPSLRSEVIILLKVIDKMDDQLLDTHIDNMIKTISNRYSKSF